LKAYISHSVAII